MNNQETRILSEQSKEIISDFFLPKTHTGKKFNARKYFDKLLIQKDKYVDRLWDENTTIVNYILSHKDFNISKTRLKELYNLSQDWSTPNENGENSVFFLLRNKLNIKDINLIIKEYDINYAQTNKEQLFFINDYLKLEPVENVMKEHEKGVNQFPEITLNKYFKGYLELIELFSELFKETALIEKAKFEHIKTILSDDKVKKYNNNKIGVVLENTLTQIEKTLLYLSFDNQFVTKNIKIKKSKI